MTSASGQRRRHTSGPYLRATVITSERSADVVLPTDQPVVELMPGLMEILSYDAVGMACVLHSTSGATVQAQRSLRHAGLRDGVVLHLLPEHEAPAEPAVADLLDLLEAERPRLGWSDEARAWTLSILGVLLVLCGFTLWTFAPGADSLLRSIASAAALWLGSALAAALGARPAAWCGAVAGGLAAGVVLVSPDLAVGTQAIEAAAALLLMIAALGWCTGQYSASVVAGVTWLAFASAAASVWAVTGNVAQTGAVVLALAAITIGVLPRVALSLSGVFTLDAAVTSGREVPRVNALGAITQAHASLSGAVVVCAIAFSGGGFVVARYAEGNRWAWALVGLALVGWVARCRHFPLATERAVMALSGTVVVIGMAWGAVEVDPSLRVAMAVACLLCGAALVASDSLRPSSLSAALWRRWVQRLEAVAVIATPPCLVGLFGVYADLLATF